MPPSAKLPERGRAPQLVLLLLMIAGTFLVPVVLMRGKSATFDEVAHLPAGYSYWKTGLFKINPQHPPLIKEICSFPLLFMDLKMPVDAETLRNSNIPLTYQWAFGRRFLYSQNADAILFRGRLLAVILSMGLACLVAIWSHRLWGIGGSLLGVALYLLDPTLTAHAQLVTTDVGLAFFATLFLFVLRGYVDRPDTRRLMLSGITLGLALGAKFSGIILIPIALILMLLAARRGTLAPDPGDKAVGSRGKNRGPARGPSPPPPRFGATSPILSLLLMTVIAWAVLWALYFFPSDPFLYLKGLATVNKDHDPGYFAYLMGELKPGRWISYFLVAYLVKTPLPALILTGAAWWVFLRGRKASFLDEAFLILPGLAFFVGYTFTADNLGIRYLIPCYPFVMIFTARLAPAAREAKLWVKAGVGVLLLWMALEFAAIWPDHLSYFNEITGIPAHGSWWLDDSNLDWGQGLIQLRDYLEKNPIADYRFCYFGSGSPSFYGVRGTEVQVNQLLSPPGPGTYILSAHCVARVRAQLSQSFGDGPGNWIASMRPRTVVGHVFEIYEIR